MRHSITRKITTIMISIVAGTVLMCWFINTTLLEDYYISHKMNVLISTFETVDEAYTNGEGDTEEFQIELEKKCAGSNITLMVISSNGTIIQSNVSNKDMMLQQFFDIMFSTQSQDAVVVESTEDYVIEKTMDTRLKSDYLVLWGNLQDGNRILLRTAQESIKESVAIANRFLAYVGIASVIVCAVVLYFVTRKITNPILQLAEISKRMTKLDFEAKFQSRGENEIDFLGEHMNQMSETLEKTISELKSANNQLKIDIEKKDQIDEMRKEFISNVSHELKTPITSMKVLAESLLIQEDAPAEMYREFMGDIVAEIDRENQIINDLLSLIKMDKKATALNISSVNINELLELLLKRLKPLAAGRNIEIVFESFRTVTAEIDDVKISLAVSNLIENAIKYNVDNGWVRVSLNADHKYFYVKVADSGVGIPEDCQTQVFERFYRVDKARSRDTGGTGLGLSITRNAILMHKGAIKLYSKPGEGTTFTMRIPLTYTGQVVNMEN